MDAKLISIHALREEGDRSSHRCRRSPGISIHALREEGDLRWATNNTKRVHFYPRPPRGGRPFMADSRRYSIAFLSTPSARRATRHSGGSYRQRTDFYPRPPRGGRRCNFCQQLKWWKISIHALREEGDPPTAETASPRANFYPRPPRGGRRLDFAGDRPDHGFLSTPSARRATAQSQRHDWRHRISIHALREEGDAVMAALAHLLGISIHALREEGDRPRH